MLDQGFAGGSMMENMSHVGYRVRRYKRCHPLNASAA